MTFYHTHPALCTILAALAFASLTGFTCLWAMLKAAAHDDDNDAWRDSQGTENPQLCHCLKCGCDQDRTELCPRCRDILKGQIMGSLENYFNGSKEQFVRRN